MATPVAISNMVRARPQRPLPPGVSVHIDFETVAWLQPDQYMEHWTRLRQALPDPRYKTFTLQVDGASVPEGLDLGGAWTVERITPWSPNNWQEYYPSRLPVGGQSRLPWERTFYVRGCWICFGDPSDANMTFPCSLMICVDLRAVV